MSKRIISLIAVFLFSFASAAFASDGMLEEVGSGVFVLYRTDRGYFQEVGIGLGAEYGKNSTFRVTQSAVYDTRFCILNATSGELVLGCGEGGCDTTMAEIMVIAGVGMCDVLSDGGCIMLPKNGDVEGLDMDCSVRVHLR